MGGGDWGVDSPSRDRLSSLMSHFANKETGFQRGEVTYPRSHTGSRARLEPRSLVTHPVPLPPCHCAAYSGGSNLSISAVTHLNYFK